MSEATCMHTLLILFSVNYVLSMATHTTSCIPLIISDLPPQLCSVSLGLQLLHVPHYGFSHIVLHSADC